MDLNKNFQHQVCKSVCKEYKFTKLYESTLHCKYTYIYGHGGYDCNLADYIHKYGFGCKGRYDVG